MHPCLLRVKAKTHRDGGRRKSTVYTSNPACMGVPVAAIGKVGVALVSGGYGTADTIF